MEEQVGLRGKFRVENPRTGEVRETDNTIMNVGKSSIASMIGSDITSAVSWDWIGVGTSGTTAAATQTQLGSEQVRTTTTASQQTTTLSDDTARFIGSFGISGTHDIQEAGLFNASSAGSMLARTTFTALSTVSGDSINATWDIKVA